MHTHVNSYTHWLNTSFKYKYFTHASQSYLGAFINMVYLLKIWYITNIFHVHPFYYVIGYVSIWSKWLLCEQVSKIITGKGYSHQNLQIFSELEADFQKWI